MKPATFAPALGTALMIALPAAGAQDAVAPTMVEVQPDPDPDADRDAEWVEFANPTPADVSLDGLYLTDHDPCFAPGEGYVETYRWPLNVTVPALDRVVVELPSNQCLNLANGGDTLVLEGEQGTVVQEVGYGTEGDLPAPSATQSLSACHAEALVHGGWATAAPSPASANQDCRVSGT